MTNSNSIPGPAISKSPSSVLRESSNAMRYRVLAAKPVSLPLLVGIILVIACVYSSIGHIRQWNGIRRLKGMGAQTTAKITKYSQSRPRGQRGASVEYIHFEFVPSESAHREPVEGRRRRSLFMSLETNTRLGDEVAVVYDPAKPESFFCVVTDDKPLGQILVVQIIVLAIAIVLLLLAALRYARLLRIVRSASAGSGTVVDIRSSSQGAFSRVLVVTFDAAEQKIIIKRVVSARLARSLIVGSTIGLLLPENKPKQAIIADAFL